MPDLTRIGFYAFAGLVLGAVAGQLLAVAPGPGALAGGVLGALLGYLVDHAQKPR